MMMEGFKVTCLKCGKENTFVQKDVFLEANNDVISINPVGYDGQIGIECECGNSVKDEY